MCAWHYLLLFFQFHVQIAVWKRYTLWHSLLAKIMLVRSDDGHSVEVRLRTGETRHVWLYDRSGNDMFKNIGDLWKISFSSFGFSCVKIGQIANVAIMESSDDGWNIESIATFVKDTAGGFEVLTQDFDIYRWVDGDGDSSHRHFDLTRAWTSYLLVYTSCITVGLVWTS